MLGRLEEPGPDFIDRVWAQSERSTPVLPSLQSLLARGRHWCTSNRLILPLDQGIPHPAGHSLAPEPQYFDPANIGKLAIEGVERSSVWRGAFAVMAPLPRTNTDDGDLQNRSPFSNAEGVLHRGPVFSDRKLLRRRAEWEFKREKILFFSLLGLLCASMSGVMLALASASQVSKIGAITALMGIVGAVLRRLARAA